MNTALIRMTKEASIQRKTHFLLANGKEHQNTKFYAREMSLQSLKVILPLCFDRNEIMIIDVH